VAVGDDGALYNVNADTAAAALATAMDAEKLVLLTDVEGLYADWPDHGSLVSSITADDLEKLLPGLQSGMVPKMEACLRAVRGGVGKAHVLDGRVPPRDLARAVHRRRHRHGGGPMTDTTTARWDASLLPTYATPQLTLVRGAGATVWDEEGRSYVDLVAGIATQRARPRAPRQSVEAVSRQIAHASATSPTSMRTPTVVHARRAAARRCSSRRAASSSAAPAPRRTRPRLKLSRRTGRTGLVAGAWRLPRRTMGALALTGQPAKRTPFEPLPGDVTVVPVRRRPRLDRSCRTLDRSRFPGAVQGEGGVIPRADRLPARPQRPRRPRPAPSSCSTRCRPGSAAPAPGSTTSPSACCPMW
jgi:hypothetical protein